MLGIDAKLWRLLRNWYKQFYCKVYIYGTLSSSFQILQRVIQGGKWSMRLFQIYYAELIDKILECNIGCSMYQIRVTCPTFADDLAVASLYPQTLQCIISFIQLYANKWRLSFNATKSATMIFTKNRSPQICNTSFSLSDNYIPCTNHYKHLGVGIASETETKCKQNGC